MFTQTHKRINGEGGIVKFKVAQALVFNFFV